MLHALQRRRQDRHQFRPRLQPLPRLQHRRQDVALHRLRGLGETLFFDGAPGAAASIFGAVLSGPDLLTPAKSRTAIPFEADLTSNSDVDIGFDLMLTEPVLMTRREDGGFDMRVQAEPEPLFEDAAALLPDGSVLKTIWAPGSADPQQLVPDPE